MHRELSKTEINNILQSQVSGRLACTDGRTPYVVPITYFFNGKEIYCQSEGGKKIKFMRINPNVCFQVDIINSMKNYQSVIVYGKYQELDELEAEKATALLQENIFNKMTRSRIHQFEHAIKPETEESKTSGLITFRINITEITGRSEQE